MIAKYQRWKDGTTGELIKLPLVSVRLACNKTHQDFYALIDSGSQLCVGSSSIAEILNVDITAGRPITLAGLVDDQGFLAYMHQVNIRVNGLGGSVNTLMAFTEDDSPVFPILGQRGFFDNLQIRFQFYREEMEIYPKSTQA
jgi:hypothetical protein